MKLGTPHNSTHFSGKKSFQTKPHKKKVKKKNIHKNKYERFSGGNFVNK